MTKLATPVHFFRDDPRLLGETLVIDAQLCFAHGCRDATYECNGQWLRFVADGHPLQVKLYEMGKETEENLLFVLEHTGDGLTFDFVGKPRSSITEIICDTAKAHAQSMKHV